MYEKTIFSTLSEAIVDDLANAAPPGLSLDVPGVPWAAFRPLSARDREGCQGGSGHDFGGFCICFGDPKVTF